MLRSIDEGEEGVILKGLSANTFAVRVDSKNKIIKVKLDGVKRLKANPRLSEVQELNEKVNLYIL